MPYAQLRGVRLYYEDRGHGVPLVLIPGALGTSQSDFGPQLEQLPGMGVRVIAFDPRGYGKSRPPKRDFPLDFYHRDAEDCAALMAHLGCESYAVGGWSDGAIIGLLLTLAHPRRVEKLVVWGGNAHISRHDIECYEKTRSLSSWSPRMRQAMGALYGDELQELWTGWCDVMYALYKAGGEVCRQRLAEIRCPTLLLHGEKDPLVPRFHADVLHQGIAGSLLHLFPDGKHNIHLAHAPAMNRLIADFLTPQPLAKESPHGRSGRIFL